MAEAPHRGFGDETRPPASDPLNVWRDQLPRVEADSHVLSEVIRHAASDPSALRVEVQGTDEAVLLPAAGLPWFLTLFGRDTIITA
jgi:glycogen debranching enzyme